MSQTDELTRYAARAVESGARELGLDPLFLARRLDRGEIAALLRLLNAARADVGSSGLRRRIEALLESVTGGLLPSETTGTELEWTLEVLARRQRRTPDVEAGGGGPEGDG